MKTYLCLLAILLTSLAGGADIARADEANWLFLEIRGGVGGARDVNFELETRGTSTGEDPLVYGHARHDPRFDLATTISANNAGGSPYSVDVSTGESEYHLDAVSPSPSSAFFSMSGWALDVPEGEPVMTLAIFYAGGRFERAPQFGYAAVEGTLDVTLVTGSGATTVALDETERSGVIAGSIGLGSFAYSASPGQGIIGAMLEGCLDCVGSWTDPTGRRSEWEWHQAEPGLAGERTFSGPAGSWMWTLDGLRSWPLDAEAALVAYAPLGEFWSRFPVAL